MEEPGKIINETSPILYRLIAKKLLKRFPGRKVSREQAKRVLGICFKIGKEKRMVFKELEDYGLLIFESKHEYYINYREVESDGED